jgi:hypothetical protein
MVTQAEYTKQRRALAERIARAVIAWWKATRNMVPGAATAIRLTALADKFGAPGATTTGRILKYTSELVNRRIADLVLQDIESARRLDCNVADGTRFGALTVEWRPRDPAHRQGATVVLRWETPGQRSGAKS